MFIIQLNRNNSKPTSVHVNQTSPQNNLTQSQLNQFVDHCLLEY